VTPELYDQLEPRGAPVDKERCAWAIHTRVHEVRQCSRKIREYIEGHGYCHPHAKLVKPDA
jgi:hypothetical protein